MKPTDREIQKAKSCPHKKQSEFIDETFTGVGLMCIHCRLLLRWVIKPDPRAESAVKESAAGTWAFKGGATVRYKGLKKLEDFV